MPRYDASVYPMPPHLRPRPCRYRPPPFISADDDMTLIASIAARTPVTLKHAGRRYARYSAMALCGHALLQAISVGIQSVDAALLDVHAARRYARGMRGAIRYATLYHSTRATARRWRYCAMLLRDTMLIIRRLLPQERAAQPYARAASGQSSV